MTKENNCSNGGYDLSIYFDDKNFGFHASFEILYPALI
jgi:hypothetical protein